MHMAMRMRLVRRGGVVTVALVRLVVVVMHMAVKREGPAGAQTEKRAIFRRGGDHLGVGASKSGIAVKRSVPVRGLILNFAASAPVML